MRIKKPKANFSNILSVIIILILIIPQTRRQLQLALNTLIAQFPPYIESRSERRDIDSFEFELKHINGEDFNLSQTKYKVTIVSFWATWCPPCIAELPSLNALYKDYKNSVEFVFISNEDPSVLKKFLKENSYSIPVYTPKSEAEDIYFKPRTLPRTLLIDRHSRIVVIEEGARNWNSEKIRGVIDKLIVGDIVY